MRCWQSYLTPGRRDSAAFPPRYHGATLELMLTHHFAKAAAVALPLTVLALGLACSSGEEPGRADVFRSAGRGAPVSPDIPWELWIDPANIEPWPPAEIEGYPEKHWLVGPFDATWARPGGERSAFIGAARNGAVPPGV